MLHNHTHCAMVKCLLTKPLLPAPTFCKYFIMSLVFGVQWASTVCLFLLGLTLFPSPLHRSTISFKIPPRSQPSPHHTHHNHHHFQPSSPPPPPLTLILLFHTSPLQSSPIHSYMIVSNHWQKQ